MFPDGLYLLYFKRFDDEGNEFKRLVSRFLIHLGSVHHLEDHFQNMDTFIPEGLMSNLVVDRLNYLKNNPYFELVDEGKLLEGEHLNHVKPLDLGQIRPEKAFDLSGEDINPPKNLEVWDEMVTLDNRPLSDDEIRNIMSKVKNGDFILKERSL